MAGLRWMIDHWAFVISVWLALAIAAIPGLLCLSYDNSPEVFFVKYSETLAHLQVLQEQFGGDRAVYIVLQGPGLWTEHSLVWLRQFETDCAKLSGVEQADGLYSHHRWYGGRWPPLDPEEFRHRVSVSSLDRNAGWISPQGDLVTVLLTLRDPLGVKETDLLRRLEIALNATPTGVHGYVTGLPVVQREMDQSVHEVVIRLFPMLILAAIAILYIALGRWNDVFLLLGFVTLVQVPVFGAMGYLNTSVNLVTIILVPLLFVISLATAVHILMRFRFHCNLGSTPGAAVMQTYREKGWPVLWTGVSTCVAFGSFSISPVPPLSNLGFWSAAGIGIMTLQAFLLFPALLVSAPIKGNTCTTRFEGWATSIGTRWSDWAIRHRVACLGSAAFMVAVALAGGTRLNVESNVLTYFSPTHPLRAQIEDLQRRGLAVVGANLLVTLDEDNLHAVGSRKGFRDPALFPRIAALEEQLRAEPLIYGVVGVSDLFTVAERIAVKEGHRHKALHRWVLGLMESQPTINKRLNSLVTEDGSIARIVLLTPMLGFRQLGPTYQHALAIAKQAFPEGAVAMTGQYPLVLQAQETLLSTMLTSLLITVLCVAIIFVLLVRSLWLSWLVLIPNLWPMVLVVGAMGWLAVPLDSTTVMIAAVVLGLAVDDTLHSLGYFRHLAIRNRPARAIADSIQRAAPAHILTSLVLVLGFGTCGTSSLVPIARFGLLTAAAILAALLADLLLVPALLAKVPAAAVDRFTPQAPFGTELEN